jgi:hypothetical protein
MMMLSMSLWQNLYLQGMFSGLVATIVLSFGLIIAKRFKEVDFLLLQEIGKIFAKKARLERVLGLLIYLFGGLFWGLVYIMLSIKLSVGLNVFSGMVFGLIPWALTLLLFKNLRSNKAKLLLFHLLYGFLLGFIASL